MSKDACPLLQAGSYRVGVTPLYKIIPRYGKVGYGNKEMQEKNHNGSISHGDKIIIQIMIYNTCRYLTPFLFQDPLQLPRRLEPALRSDIFHRQVWIIKQRACVFFA